MRYLTIALAALLSLTVHAAPSGFRKGAVAQKRIDCRVDKKSGAVHFSGRGAVSYKPAQGKFRIENCYEAGRQFLVLEYKAEVEFASRPGDTLFYEIVWIDGKGHPHGVLSEDVSKFPVEAEWGEHESDKLPMVRFVSRDKAGKVKGEMFFKFDPAAEDPVFKAVLEESKPLG